MAKPPAGSVGRGSRHPRPIKADPPAASPKVGETDREAVETGRPSADAASSPALDRLRHLQGLTAALSRAVSLDEVVAVILHQGAAAVGAAAATVLALSNDGEWLTKVASAGYPEETRRAFQRYPVATSVPAADAVRSGEAVWLVSAEDFRTHYPQLTDAVNAIPYEAAAAVPLSYRGRITGVLALSFPHVQPFDEDARSFMQTLAGHCALALERARLYTAEQTARRQAERSVAQITQLQMVTAALSNALTPAEVVQVIMQQGAGAVGAKAMSVKLLSTDGLWLENAGMPGASAGVKAAYNRYPLTTDTQVADAVRTQEPIWLETAEAQRRRYPEAAEAAIADGLEALCAIPLRLGPRVVGALGIGFAHAMEFTPELREFLVTLADQCAQALDRARLYEIEQHSRSNLEIQVAQRTAELRLEVQRRHLVQQQLERWRESERTRIARELHDELGGTLTGLKMSIKRLRSQPECTPPVADALDRLAGEVDEAVQAVRRIATELRPAVLDDFGLVAALAQHLQEFTQRTDLAATFENQVDELDLPSDRATGCFRIVQEALTNVARHAQATAVRVRVDQLDGQVTIQVIDNGCGFDPQALPNVGHWGLEGMRERAGLMNGTLEVISRPSQGSTVVLRVPV